MSKHKKVELLLHIPKDTKEWYKSIAQDLDVSYSRLFVMMCRRLCAPVSERGQTAKHKETKK